LVLTGPPCWATHPATTEKLGVLAALDQRIGLRYAMLPMIAEETGRYLRHHMEAGERAGGVHVVVGQHADQLQLGMIE
jgi:type II secretory pathway predicted ATPase ExeA